MFWWDLQIQSTVIFIIRTKIHKSTVQVGLPGYRRHNAHLYLCHDKLPHFSLFIHCTTKLNSCTANAEFASHSRDAEICWAAIWTQRRGPQRDAKRAGNARSAERALALRSTKRLYAHRHIKIDSPLTESLWQHIEPQAIKLWNLSQWLGRVSTFPDGHSGVSISFSQAPPTG